LEEIVDEFCPNKKEVIYNTPSLQVAYAVASLGIDRELFITQPFSSQGSSGVME
jgi:hypothetical protein